MIPLDWEKEGRSFVMGILQWLIVWEESNCGPCLITKKNLHIQIKCHWGPVAAYANNSLETCPHGPGKQEEFVR